MSQLQDIRGQIASVRQTRQITQAMQRIAFIKMRNAKERAETLRPYARHLNRIVARLMAVDQGPLPPLMARRQPAARIGVLVVTTDKGLCGALNIRLLSMVLGQLALWQQAGCQVSVTAIGSRGLRTLRRAGARIVAQAIDVGEPGAAHASALLGALAVPLHQFIDGQIDALYVASNHLINTLQYEPVLARFLPFGPEMLELALPAGTVDYRYVPPPAEAVDALLLRYVETAIYRAIVENAACEQCARMAAMKAATENATRVIDELTVRYHRSRQEAITRELSEIVAGAAALTGG
jgi:F-type H+-transporting ATPase subunit gamma